MKRILCSLLVATLPFGSVLADAPKSNNAKVTLVYQHEPPNVPGKSIKGVLVEYSPGGYSPGHTHAKSASPPRPANRKSPGFQRVSLRYSSIALLSARDPRLQWSSASFGINLMIVRPQRNL
jgi:hypothetical protein